MYHFHVLLCLCCISAGEHTRGISKDQNDVEGADRTREPTAYNTTCCPVLTRKRKFFTRSQSILDNAGRPQCDDAMIWPASVKSYLSDAAAGLGIELSARISQIPAQLDGSPADLEPFRGHAVRLCPGGAQCWSFAAPLPSGFQGLRIALARFCHRREQSICRVLQQHTRNPDRCVQSRVLQTLE